MLHSAHSLARALRVLTALVSSVAQGHNAESYYLIGKALASGMLEAMGEKALPGFPTGQSKPGCSPDHLCPGLMEEQP